MFTLPVSKLDQFFAAVAADRKLYLPVDDAAAGHAEYKVWQEGDTLSTALNTVKSAKDFFFPQTEDLVNFKMQGKTIEVVDNRTESEEFAIFGVRACDARSFDILDRVFLAEPVDTFYKNRREHGLVITMACTRPAETCFCTAFGIDPTEPAGDVSCWMDETSLYLKANNEKGEAFLSSLSSLLEEGGEEAVAAQKEATKAIVEKLPLGSLDLSKFKPENLLALFDSPRWADLSEACLGCGSCTFVCPTCQCYDIRDFDTGHGVQRYRCWDSCMYSDFTRMAHGNPRLTQKERFRQRFMHKLVYYPSNNEGLYSCVGCGRCLTKCPISMNIAKVIKALGEEA